MHEMKKRLFRFFIIITVNLGIFLGIFLIAEAVLRVFDLPFRGSYHPLIYRDSYIRKYIPNEPYEYKGQGYSKGRFNSHGYRDYERSLVKPHNAFRIAILGDSMTEGIGVSLERTFCALTEKDLRDPYNKKFEVMNFGVSGYATGDEYILLKKEVMDYSPDMVVLVFFSGNDLIGNYSRIERLKRRFYFDIDEDNNLVLDDSYYKKYLNSTEGRLRLLLDGRSRVLRGLITLYRDLAAYRRWGIPIGSRFNAFDVELAVYDVELSDDYKTAWKITEQLLSRFKEYVESKNAKFLMVSIPAGIQFLEPEVPQAKLLSRSLNDKPEQILHQISSRKGINYLDLLPVFMAKNKESGEIPYFITSGQYGHLNEIGHKWVSEALSRYIYEFSEK